MKQVNDTTYDRLLDNKVALSNDVEARTRSRYSTGGVEFAI